MKRYLKENRINVSNSELEELVKNIKKTKEIIPTDNFYTYILEKFRNFLDPEKVDNKIVNAVLERLLENSKDDREKIGIVLSALINYSSHSYFELSLVGVNHIGMYNDGKSIVIEGDIYSAGYRMQDGKIIVKGNVKYSVGDEIQGGKINVEGRVGWAGYRMKNGEINIEDYVTSIGSSMQGGKIIVKDNVGSAGYNMQGGEIIIKGDVEFSAGKNMQGGKMVIEGNVEKSVGDNMQGGKIIIKGYAKGTVGYNMQGGEIYGNLSPEQISNHAKKGKIYQGTPPNAKLIWNDGEFFV